MGIKHILAVVGKPTTTGKVERWFGTYDREAWRFETLDDFLSCHDHVRPHQSLGHEKPMEVFFADLIEYQWSPLRFR